MKLCCLLLIGALIAGPATFLMLDGNRPEAGRSFTAGIEPPTRSADTAVGSAISADAAAAERTGLTPALDASSLEALIAEAGTEPASPERDVELTAWLARLAESDPASAANLALSLELPETFLHLVFKLWAESDPDAALTATARLTEPLRHNTAVALTDVLGAGPPAIERIAAALRTETLNLQLDALMRQSQRHPRESFDIANELTDPRTRYLAFQDMGAIWGGQDPLAALAAAESAPSPGPGTIFYQRVFQAWSRLDAEGFLAYAADSTHPNLSAGFAEAAMGDPALAIQAAENLPDPMRLSLTTQALRVLAGRDPVAAVAHVADLPLGSERDRMLRVLTSSGRITISDGQPVVMR